MKHVSVLHNAALPTRSISALTTRAGEDGGELLAAGDEDLAVIVGELDDDGRPVQTWPHDLCRLVPGESLASHAGPGFEGIASDAMDR